MLVWLKETQLTSVALKAHKSSRKHCKRFGLQDSVTIFNVLVVQQEEKETNRRMELVECATHLMTKRDVKEHVKDH